MQSEQLAWHQDRRIEQAVAAQINVKSTIEEYVHREDWRIKANANQGYSWAA